MDSLNHQQQLEIEPTVLSIIALDASLEIEGDEITRSEIIETRNQLFEALVERISVMTSPDRALGIANLAIEEADLHSSIPTRRIEQLLSEISSILNQNETAPSVA